MHRPKTDSANPSVASESPSVPATYLARLMAEPALPTSRLADECGVDSGTVARWIFVGIKGRAVNGVRPVIKLESYKIGGRLYTSRPAWERFVAAQNSHIATPPSSHSDRTDVGRRAASESAAQRAEALGY